MKNLRKLLSTTSLLALSLFAWGCSDIASTDASLDPSPMIVTSTTGETYVVAQETDPNAGSISADIGSAGGELTLGLNKLYVAAGAVGEVTTFTMTRNPESAIRVDLDATRETENDVGAAGFDAPVTLELNYANAQDLPGDLSNLTLMYFRPDGLVETLPTAVDSVNAQITADLPHFSVFGLGWP